MTKSLKPIYLVKRWEHHTRSGGYDHAAGLIPGTVVKRSNSESLAFRALRQLWKRAARQPSHLLDYDLGDFIAEWSVIGRSLVSPPDVVHALYGDEQLDVVLRHKSLLRAPLVATFHLPANRVKERFENLQPRLLKQLDAAIVVSTSQLEDFQRWLGRDKVIYIPHGIDTQMFKPANPFKPEKKRRFLSVGEHMRDWQTLHRVIDRCEALELPVEFDVVCRPAFYSHFTGCRNVRLHSGVSEESLIKLYQQADALLMPVLDATANNAALEAIACGTPVISTAVGGMSDYVEPSAGWLLPRENADDLLRLIQSICSEPWIAATRRAAARTSALRFDWQRISEQFSIIYQAVIAHQSPSERLNVSRGSQTQLATGLS